MSNRRSETNKTNGFWTPERVAILRDDYAKGLGALHTAKTLGTTRCAITSKRDRLGLFSERPQGLPRTRPTNLPPPTAAKTLRAIIEAVPDTAIPYADWTPSRKTCNWIIGDPGPTAVVCCGEVVRFNLCTVHAAKGLHKPASPEEKIAASKAADRMARRWA